MKTLKKLAAVASIAAVHTGSIISAQEAETVSPEIIRCESFPKIIKCEPAPEIAVCPEPGIFPEPEIPEICVLPPPTGEPAPIDDHTDPIIHIDPVVEDPTAPVEGPTDPEVTEDGEVFVDENAVVDSGDSGEISSEDNTTNGSDESPVGNEVNDSGDPAANNEVSTTVDDTSVDFEKGVPIEWIQGGTNYDPRLRYNPAIAYFRGGNSGTMPENEETPVSIASNSVSDSLAPALDKGEASNGSARGLGQEDKATAIATKANSSTPKILVEKKEPVALIKKGRVFLR